MPPAVTIEWIVSVAAFCFAGSLTPGPNNLMLLASGVNYGFARTLPHILGVVLGYALLLSVMGLGLGRAFVAFPLAHVALKIAGGGYLVWLAWKIANAGPAQVEDDKAGRPFTFVQAATFQWVNVKGVLVAISALAAFTSPQAPGATLPALVAIAALASCVSAVTWAAFGSGLSRWISHPRVLRPFNVGMALLLLASLWPMLS